MKCGEFLTLRINIRRDFAGLSDVLLALVYSETIAKPLLQIANGF